jgi:hypothetical protein
MRMTMDITIMVTITNTGMCMNILTWAASRGDRWRFIAPFSIKTICRRNGIAGFSRARFVGPECSFLARLGQNDVD